MEGEAEDARLPRTCSNSRGCGCGCGCGVGGARCGRVAAKQRALRRCALRRCALGASRGGDGGGGYAPLRLAASDGREGDTRLVWPLQRQQSAAPPIPERAVARRRRQRWHRRRHHLLPRRRRVILILGVGQGKRRRHERAHLQLCALRLGERGERARGAVRAQVQRRGLAVEEHGLAQVADDGVRRGELAVCGGVLRVAPQVKVVEGEQCLIRLDVSPRARQRGVEVVHRACEVVTRDVDEGEVTVHVAELRVDGVGGLAVSECLRVPVLVGAQRAELVVELGRSRADLHGRDEGRLVARPIEGAPQAECRQVAHRHSHWQRAGAAPPPRMSRAARTRARRQRAEDVGDE